MKEKFKQIIAMLKEHIEWMEIAGHEYKRESHYLECVELSAWLEGLRTNLLDFDEAKNRSVVMSKLGKAGGTKGGPARAKALSPERRKEIATEAAKTRWSGLIRAHKIN